MPSVCHKAGTVQHGAVGVPSLNGDGGAEADMHSAASVESFHEDGVFMFLGCVFPPCDENVSCEWYFKVT